MKVTRIERGDMSHAVPPLNSEWPERKQLEWKAAVAEHDTGVRFTVKGGRFAWARRDHYTVNVGESSITPLSFGEAWTYITGAEAGIKSARLGKSEGNG